MKALPVFGLRIVLLAALIFSCLGMPSASRVEAGSLLIHLLQSPESARIHAHPRAGIVHFWEFSPNTTLVIRVYDSQGGNLIYGPVERQTDENGAYMLERDPQIGEFINVYDSGFDLTKELLVENVVIQSVNANTNVVSGIGAPGRSISLYAPFYDGSYVESVPIDDFGNWSFDYETVGFDLLPDMPIEANLTDEDGDLIQDSYEYRAPFVLACISCHDFNLWNFTLNSVATLRIYDSQGGMLIHGPVDININSNGFAWYPYNIQPGMYVVATDATIGDLPGLLVEDLTFTSFDAATNVIGGEGPAGHEANINVRNYDEAGTSVTIAESGLWSFDFDEIGFDLLDEMKYSIEVWIADENGNTTNTFLVHPPSVMVVFQNNNTCIDLENFEPDTTVPVQIYTTQGGELLWQSEIQVNSAGNGSCTRPGNNVEIEPGMFIRAQYGSGQEKTLIVHPLTVDGINPDTDIMFGTAEPLAHIYAVIYEPEWLETGVDADAGGNWQADFSDQLDLLSNARGFAQISDMDEDATRADSPEPPHISGCISCSNFNFRDFSHNSTINVEIFDQPGGTRIFGPQSLTTDDDGFAQLNYRMQSGQFIRARDSETNIVKELQIVELAVSSVDPDTNLVTGRGPDNQSISLIVPPHFGSSHVRSVPVDASGDWSYDFDNIAFDITAEMLYRVEASFYDSDGDLTQAYMIRPPIIGIEKPYNTVFLTNATPTGMARFEIFAHAADTEPEWQDERQLNEYGELYLNSTWFDIDLQEGMRVQVTDLTSGVARVLDVRTLAVGAVDYALDRISGTAIPNASLMLYAKPPNQDRLQFAVTASATGQWNFNFASVPVDITRDFRLSIEYTEPDGDLIRAYPSTPAIAAGWEADNILVGDFPPHSSVRIRVLNGAAVLFTGFCQTLANTNCIFPEDDLTVNLLPGYTVEASHGQVIKSLLLVQRSIEGMDAAADTIWGTALPNETFRLRIRRPWMGTIFSRMVTAAANGEWSIDTGDFGYDQLLLDRFFTRIEAWDDDYDQQHESFTGNYAITANPDSDEIKLEVFAPNIPVTVTIRNEGTVLWQGQVDPDFRGRASLPYDLHGINLWHGLTISTAQAGQPDQQMTVSPLGMTGVDEANDILSGTAPAGTSLIVYAGNATSNNQITDAQWIETQSVGGGRWTADFSEWMDISSETQLWAFVMQGDHRTRVNRPSYFTLTTQVDPVGGGSITAAPAPNGPDSTYYRGTRVHLEAVANAGFGFSGWSGAGIADPESAETTVVMDSNKTVTASFAPCYNLALTASPADGGEILASPTANCPGGYVDGTEVTLTPSANVGYTFYAWTGDLDGAASPRTLVIHEDMAVQANFINSAQITPLIVTLVSPGNGSTISGLDGLEWQSLTSVLSRPYRYEVQLSTATSFTPLNASTLTGEGVTIYNPSLADGRYYWRVRAINQLNYAGPWSAAWSFTLDSSYTGVPTLASPANGAAVLGTPLLRWNAASGAYRYMVAWSTAQDFNSQSESDELAMTSFTPPTLAEGTYYWRVRARDLAGNWGAYSSPRSFTVELPIPQAPLLLTPANKAFTNESAYEFSWSVPSYAARYEILIDNQSGFGSPEISRSDLTNPSLSADLTGLTSGLNYWRVRAFNSDGTNGPWSAVRTFTYDINAPSAPLLLTPANSASVRGTPKFTWRSVTGAVNYVLQIYTNAAEPDPSAVYTSPLLAVVYHTPPVLTAPQIYLWRVRAIDAAGNLGIWSAPFTLILNLPVPVKPTLLMPNSAVLSNSTAVDFSWSAVTYGEQYELMVDTDTGFNPPLLSVQDLTATAHNVDVSTWADGRYYWRVRAVNDYAESGWTTARILTLDRVPPAQVQLTAPANHAAGIRTNAVFSWVDQPAAALYEFQAATNPGFTEGIYTAQTTSNGHQPVGLQPGPLYWHVRARDEAGNWGSWSTVSFDATLIPPLPGKVTQTNPLHKFNTNLQQPDFNWIAAEWADHYDLQLAKASGFSGATLISREVDGLSFTPDAALSAGTWYWRVRAVNAQDEKGVWSSVRSLVIDVTPPAAPSLASPANNAVITTVTPTLSWGAVTSAASYQVEVASDDGFTSIVTGIANLTARTYTVPALDTGEYFWRVRARDAAGNLSPWSTVRRFTCN